MSVQTEGLQLNGIHFANEEKNSAGVTDMEILEQQTRKLIDTFEDFVVLLNSEGTIIHVNQNWIDYCLAQQLPETLWRQGLNYFTCLEKMNKLNELQCIENVLSGSTEEERQVELFYTDGSIRYLLVKYRPFQLNDNSTGIILYKNCINHSMNLSHLKSETILENMTDAFFLLDKQMRFSFVNSKTEKLLQKNREKLIGQSIWSCFPEAVGSSFYSNYNRVSKDRVSLHFEEYYAPLKTRFKVKVCPVQDGGISVYYQKVRKDDEIEALLSEIPYRDYVTGWPNRQKFEESLEEQVTKKMPFSLLYINLDNFKHFNILYDHKTGDEILNKISNNLNEVVLPHELAGRLDGDELILLHFHQTTEELQAFTEQIQEVVIRPLVLENNQSVSVSASIGVSSYPKDSPSAQELISFAETAMREAKKQRGTSLSFFTSSMGMDLARRLTIEKSLAGDLDSLGFHFALQPQVQSETGELTGVEVLARWNHPSLGFLSPVEFIAIAEETGTITRLTTCLLRNVFCFLKDLETHGIPVPKTAVNITPSMLSSSLFFDDLFALMEEYSILPEWMELEITESVELTYSEITLNNLQACQAKGISIALDDFGTGFSMLAYLMDYPIDKIKLDKSFISKIGHDAHSEAVLISLIQFINGINCELLAEGVETKEESVFLQENGCLIHQGYYYDKPLMPEAFSNKYLSVFH